MAIDNDPNLALRPFLLIEQKEDSQLKLQSIVGKPTKNYLYALEFNKVVAAINKLRTLIQLTPIQIEQIIATGIRIDFGEISDLDFLNDYINGEYYGQSEYGTQGTTFIVYRKDGVKYVYTFIGIPGTYGGTYTEQGEFVVENPMSLSDLELIYDGSLSVQLPLPKFKTFKAIFNMQGNVYVDANYLINEIDAVQVWGTPRNIVLKYFEGGVTGQSAPWPAGTFISYSNIIQNNIVLNYGHQFFSQGQNSSINMRCPEFDIAQQIPATLCVEITIPNL